MIGLLALPILATAAATPAEKDISELLTGTYTNEEQVYFEQDAGRTAPPWLSLTITEEDGRMALGEVDAFGNAKGNARPLSFSPGSKRSILTAGSCARFFEQDGGDWKISAVQNRKKCNQKFQITAIGPDGLSVRFESGQETTLKRARAVECWAAIPKKEPKEDGSTDWFFARKINLHDQGGRVTVGGGDSGAEAVTLRMRAVHWPPPTTNRPSMVLYVHKDDPVRAASYSWADIDASRVGLNLRWMQASCTIKGAERPSKVSKDSFRG